MDRIHEAIKKFRVGTAKRLEGRSWEGRMWIQIYFAIVWLAVFAASQTFAGERVLARIGDDHYTGTWLEIGRTPMFITDGCVAGYTTYQKADEPKRVLVEDGCFEKTPNGEKKSIRGIGTIVETENGSKATLRVKYPWFIVFEYRVLYKSPDKRWFISADKDMNNLWIYARSAPSKSGLKTMVAKAASLGYDVGKLEFPKTK
ncbi:MAG TPA: lipocalin family protein [Ensifer sp.]|nr:lipocalin family protein [Ensifer sp.]